MGFDSDTFELRAQVLNAYNGITRNNLMCGFAGLFAPANLRNLDAPVVLEEMGNSLSHRGPDDSGIWFDEKCGLSFRRLSIIDLENGHQPMSSNDQKYHIVFNGEIYNFKELRSELKLKGFVFRTNSDTEVILHSYAAWGKAVVSKLRGMFAFVIYDSTKNEIFAARDHTGIKPFYFCMIAGIFVFASEAKALLKHPQISASLNESALPAYLSFLWVPPAETLFDDIKVLKPGHFAFVNSEGFKEARYWHPGLDEVNPGESETKCLQEIDLLLAKATEEQMMSDVPLGAFLSGGVDSSLIVHYMNQANTEAVTTYSTGFHQADLDQDVIRSDLPFARIASEHLNVVPNELILEPNIADLLPVLTWHMDEPLADPAAISTYLICKACKENATVMLSGVGGDEIFGGYPRYYANQLAEQYQKIPGWVRNGIIEPIATRIPSGSNRILRDSAKFFKSAGTPFPQRYFGFLSYYSKSEMNSLLNSDFEYEQAFSYHKQILDQFPGASQLQSAMNLDLMTFLPQLNLAYTDKMSMAASVEVRVPFLDHRLIESAARLPDSLKLSNGQGKIGLKKIAATYLPEEIVWRKKAGFGAPIGAWLKGQLNEMMLDLLSHDRIRRRGYFSANYVHALVDQHIKGTAYNANQLWQLLTFELWLQEFID